MIHVIGDSHASNIHSGWKHCKNIISHHIPGTLCFSFGRDKLKRCNIKNYNINNGDVIIFCFGEIDCRNHVKKYITPTNTYKNIIDNIIKNYIDAININLRQITKDVKVCIYNVIPPVPYIKLNSSHPFPFLGSDNERKKFVNYFNLRLKQECKNQEFVFFDIYNEIKDENGFLRKELKDNTCHLIDGNAINKFIINNL